jgi:hypothetical protein
VSFIFPTESAHTALRMSAWEAYLVFSRPYDSCLRVLRSQYARASVEDEVPPRWTWHGLHAPRVGLGEHLLAYFWRGLLNIDDSDGLLRAFFAGASPDVRARSLAAVGSRLSRTVEVDPVMAARLMELWQWRHSEVGAANRAELHELQSYAWWLECECFPVIWRLGELDGLLDMGCPPDPVSFAFRFLKRTAVDEPARTVQLLQALLRLVNRGWGIPGSTDDIMETLRACLASGDAKAQSKAVDLVHWLGSLGYHAFRVLLHPEA